MATYNKYVDIKQPAPGPGAMGGLNEAMVKVCEKYDNVVVILTDMGMTGIDWFKKNAPHRIIECGIAEANAAAIAGGLAAEGFMPFLSSFVFAAIGRAYNQIRQSILVDRFNVKIMGREGAWGETGISHNSVEGISYTRVMQNLVILNPADNIEAAKAFIAMADYIGPVFFRQEMGPPGLNIFTEDYPFNIGKAYQIKGGKDAAIIATGSMVTIAIRAIDILEKEGLDVGILNVSTLKPLDEEAIVKAAQEGRAVVTAENNSIIGGLGEGVAAVLGENMPSALVRFGIEDEFSQSGKRTPQKDDLMEHFALSPQDMAVSVREAIALRDRLKLR